MQGLRDSGQASLAQLEAALTSNRRAACSTCCTSAASSVAANCTTRGAAGCACCSPAAGGCAAGAAGAAAVGAPPTTVISRLRGSGCASLLRAWGAVLSTKACSSSPATASLLGTGADSCTASRPARSHCASLLGACGRAAASAGSQDLGQCSATVIARGPHPSGGLFGAGWWPAHRDRHKRKPWLARALRAFAQMPLPSRCRTPACVDCAAGGAATGPGQEVRAKKAAPSGGQGGKPRPGRICKCTGRAAAPRGLASRS